MTTLSERALQMADKARLRAAAERDALPEQRAANRASMPLSAAFVDDFRAVFGRLPYGSFTETGPDGVERSVRWGKKSEGA